MDRDAFKPMPWNAVTLRPSLFQHRAELNRSYMISLHSDDLLQNYYLEAGLWSPRRRQEGGHGGWEAPTCQLRGHFLGHWLSAAAKLYAATADAEIKGKADWIVAELARCQRENGGEWAGSIPTTYLEWIARGKSVWAPHYTVHKTLMGLHEMFALTGNEQALEVLINWARWFHRWTGQFSRAQMDDILDVETGGMLEVWANLYGITKNDEYLELLYRYDRPRFFEPLLAGKDVLSLNHANTTIPEVHGAARAWEVTGDERWRRIVDAYWRAAVTDRGYFCTGGQTNDEVWTPPMQQSAWLGKTNQEHCVVYNMMRLADWLLRWTGDVAYVDYWERNLYNGVLAQQHRETGMVAYYLPLWSGAEKKWGTPTEHFWCCHGTLTEAHTVHGRSIYFEDDEGLAICQYIPSDLTWERDGTSVHVTQTLDMTSILSQHHRSLALKIHISCTRPTEFTLKIRLPWWLHGDPTIEVDGTRERGPFSASSYYAIRRTWQDEMISVVLPKELAGVPLTDDPRTFAFMDGPVVLAGLDDTAPTLFGTGSDPWTLLTPQNEGAGHLVRTEDRTEYRTHGQPRDLRFVPLFEVTSEHYSVYFPVQEKV